MATTETRSRLSSPLGLDRLTSILGGLGQVDYSKEPEGAGADQLYMLSTAELNKRRRSDEFDQLRSQISSWRSQCETARTPYEQQWRKNLDMYEGRQFTRWDETTRAMAETPTPDGEVRIPMNFIQPVIRTELAKTSSSHPMASVSPASNDEVDMMAAQAGEQAWEHFYVEEKIQSRVLNQMNFWRAITGNGFGKTFYDLHAEDRAATALKVREWRRQQEANGSTMTSFGELVMPQAPKPDAVYGKVSATSVSPFHLLVPDLAEPDIQKQPYLIQLSLIQKETAKMIYADVMGDDWEPQTATIDDIVESTTIGLGSAHDGTTDQVLVMEVWIKPNVTRFLPKGGLVVLVDDEVVALSDEGIPYEHGEFPYQHIYTIETGRFYRTSVIEALIPLQNEINRIFAQLIKYKNMTSAPMMFYRPGSLDPTKIRTKAGTWIPVMLGMDLPQPVPLPEIPSYVPALIDAIKAYVDDISGQHQVSRAISPGADTAASAISILREADDDYLSNTIDSIEAAVESMARQTLVLMVQFWDEPRLVKVSGDGQRISAKELAGADIAAGTDIRVLVGTGLPQSKSARTALITEWMDKGYVPVDVGLKAIEGGSLGKLFKQIQIDEDAAERENVKIRNVTEAEYKEWEEQATQAVQQQAVDQAAQLDAQGIPPETMLEPQVDPMTGEPVDEPQPVFLPVNEWDNHLVHIAVIERLLKSQEFEGWPEWRQEIAIDHWKAHREAFAAQQPTDPAMMGDPTAEGGDPTAEGGDPTQPGGDAPADDVAQSETSGYTDDSGQQAA